MFLIFLSNSGSWHFHFRHLHPPSVQLSINNYGNRKYFLAFLPTNKNIFLRSAPHRGIISTASCRRNMWSSRDSSNHHLNDSRYLRARKWSYLTASSRLVDEFYTTHLRDWRRSRSIRYALLSRSDSIVNSHFLRPAAQEATSWPRAHILSRRNAWMALNVERHERFLSAVVLEIVLYSWRDPAQWVLP